MTKPKSDKPAARASRAKRAVAKEKAADAPKRVRKPKEAPAPVVEAAPGMTSAERHEWLETAAAWCKRALDKAGYPVPEGTRVSFGFAGRSPRKTLGFCFHSTASSHGVREVFVGPHVQDPVEIVGVVLHELIHAALPDKEGHGKNFGKVARMVGLEGKLTATTVGEGLKETIETRFLAHHPYNGGTINLALGLKKQTTRLIKVQCATCEYTARTTAKWLNAAGPPLCPIHPDEPMEVDGQ